MSPLSSISGHPRHGGPLDDREWSLRAFIDTGTRKTKYPVGRVMLRNAFVYTPNKHRYNTRFHLPRAAAVAWREDQPPRYQAQTMCGRYLTWFTTSMDAPAGLEICDECALAEYLRPAVYRFFDADDRLLYVGYSRTVLHRIKQHSRDPKSQRWWIHQVHASVEWFETEEEGLAAETAAIRSEKPLYNRRSVPQREWVGAA
ncbi:UvrABC system protein C [Actinoplanes sp. SE50]|uniref:nucleotide excision repair endonuclease n=1 Tax=unclassified Actinoplanes TaxID=2626549 RepID=UPI00023ED2B5|nr:MULTISPECIES: nucleotide excision repair endonuclease [unclassified Actinoplanes]AEV86671.1 UvrABC system protein C [Actinoplanes sp. SE50/110]ATO85069.1 UvrABC system protein C [Actinoplanes sp. SE50]SLM02480.1 nucleotide excision repair endonuclease [Actinoplanes sp. SE50/110]